MSRVYRRREDIARSLYRRGKERGFTTEDVARMHFLRQGKRAHRWAAQTIFVMRRDGLVESSKATPEIREQRGKSKHRYFVLYTFTTEALRKWDLHE